MTGRLIICVCMKLNPANHLSVENLYVREMPIHELSIYISQIRPTMLFPCEPLDFGRAQAVCVRRWIKLSLCIMFTQDLPSSMRFQI